MHDDVVQFGFPEEQGYGFAQGVRVGNLIYVSGQVGRDGDERPADMGGQMRIAYRRIARALAHWGATMSDVVDETVYVADMREAAKVVRDVRAEVYPEPRHMASTLIAVAGIGSPDAAVRGLVEIKCTAHVER
jgi:2-iminobutanoate/2-iminopropanoate deaminase